MASIKGLTIEIAGNVTPLNKALGEVNSKSRDLKSELRDVDRLLKLDPTNTELLAQKQKILAESVENTNEKLDKLKEAEKQAQEEFKKGNVSEEQYRALQREVVKTEQNLKGLEAQLKQVNQKWEDAAKKLENFGKSATDAGKKMSMTLTAPIVAAAGVSFKLAADLEDAMGATEQIFGKSAQDIKKWAGDLEGYYGIATSEALEYSNMMGSMLQNIGGLTEDEAAKQAATLIELAGDLSAMYGGTTADAVQALTGALKGNNTMLDNYGMAANDALIKAKALEMGLYDGTGAMDLQTKQAATLALIMEQSADAQGQAGRESEGASGSMKKFTKITKDLSASFGDELLPIITPMIEKIAELLKKFSELSPETKRVILIILAVVAAIGPLLIVIGMVASGISTIMPLLAGLIPLILGISAPVLIVIGVIAALIAIGVLLYKNWEKIKEVGKSVVDAITGFFKKAGSLGRDFVNGIAKGIKESVDFVVNIAKNLGKSIVGGIKSFFKIKSPSKLMSDEVGKPIALGVAQGIKENESAAISAARKMAAEAFSASKEWIDRKKYYNELSLNEELKAWKRVQDRYVEGSVERIEADKQVFDAKKKITAEIERLEKEYTDAVKKRTDEILRSFGLFSEVEKSETVSGTKLIKNLKDQNDAITNFFDNLQALKDRGVGDELVEEIKGLGIGASGELKGLLALSDDDLQRYANLFGEKQKIANEQALAELGVLKTETDTKITELINGVESEFGRSPQIAKGMVQGIIDGMSSMAPTAIANARGIANSIMAEFDRISVPMGGSTSKKSPTPRMAAGGSITSGTAIVGEAGAELLTLSPGVAKVTPLGAGGKGDLASEIANAIGNTIAMGRGGAETINLTVNVGTDRLADKLINLNETALKNQGTMKIKTVEV